MACAASLLAASRRLPPTLDESVKAHKFSPSITYRALVLASGLAFAVFYLLPQFEVVDSIAARSALELDGYGALVALAHPLSIATHTVMRILFVVLLFFGYAFGRYVLIAAMLLVCVSAGIGGLSVLTALDLLALTVLSFIDGYLLSRSMNLQLLRER